MPKEKRNLCPFRYWHCRDCSLQRQDHLEGKLLAAAKTVNDEIHTMEVIASAASRLGDATIEKILDVT